MRHKGLSRVSGWVLGCTAGMAVLLTGCSGGGDTKPPERATDLAPTPQDSSVIVVPIAADPKSLSLLLEEAVPRRLWSINQHSSRCVAPQKVKIFGAKLKVTPPISCTIQGQVTRGAIRLHGAGKDIVADIPIQATIHARDIGGVLKGETATGSAMVRAHIALDIRPDWTPVGTVRLSYDWTTPPGIDFLGQRMAFRQLQIVFGLGRLIAGGDLAIGPIRLLQRLANALHFFFAEQAGDVQQHGDRT